MKRRDVSWSVALNVALVLHGVAFIILARVYARELAKMIYQPGFDQRPAIYALDPDDHEDIGNPSSGGIAIHASDGPDPMQARESPEDQAALSRDPEGPGDPNHWPSMSTQAPGQGGEGGIAASATPAQAEQQPASFGVAAPEMPAAPKVAQNRSEGVSSPEPQKQSDTPETAQASADHPPKPGDDPARAQPVVASDDTPVKAQAQAHAVDSPTPQSPQHATTLPTQVAMVSPSQDSTAAEHASASARPGAPGSPQPAADPAPQSDSESDAFSHLGAAEFHNGRLDARFGRKIKTVRPRLGEAGMADMYSMASPSIVLQVKTDAAGKVTLVEVLRSSGSNQIDEPMKLAMYDWWIEPPKDKKTGNPLPDTMLWNINFR